MYRMVDCGTWGDPWFAELGPEAKLLFVYLLTNQRTNAAGAFELTARQMAFDTGLPLDRVRELLGSYGDRVAWWPEHQIVFVKNFHRRQYGNEKFRIAASRVVAGLPAAVADRVLAEYPELGDPSRPVCPPANTQPIPYVEGMGTHAINGIEQEQGREATGQDAPSVGPPRDERGADAPPPSQVRPVPKPKPVTTPLPDGWEPGPGEVAWAAAQGYRPELVRFETEKFRDHYAAKGERKADWAAAWRNWLRRAGEFAPIRGSPNSSRAADRANKLAEAVRLGMGEPP